MTLQGKQRDIAHFVGLVLAVLVVYALAGVWRLRADLTGDKRYTLSAQTTDILEQLPGTIYIKVYLEGEMPVGMRTLQRAVRDMLYDMRLVSDGRLQFEFINPSASQSKGGREAFYKDLYNKGILPFTLQEKNAEGGFTQLNLFPGALVAYGDAEYPVNLIATGNNMGLDQSVGNAIQNLEYALTNALAILTRQDVQRIAFIEGHGELHTGQVADIGRELADYYQVDRVTLEGRVAALDGYRVAVVAKPRQPWPEADKLVLDQFIMRGGRVAWFVDAVTVHDDSLANGNYTYGLVNETNLDDMLFKYGVRLQPNVVQDLQCAMIPVNVSPAGMPAKFSPMPWTYFPLLLASPQHAITRNLSNIKAEFPGSIDTLGTKDVHKTILLTSSDHAYLKGAPFEVSLQQVTDAIDPYIYNKRRVPVAVLLEGSFYSIFANRPLTRYNQGQSVDFVEHSPYTRQLVVADGDIIRNEVLASGRAYPLGYDRYTKQVLYANKDFVRNAILYLTDDDQLMELRNKVVAMRLLDRARITRQRTRWMLINTLVPLLVLGVGGGLFVYLRRRRYAGKG